MYSALLGFKRQSPTRAGSSEERFILRMTRGQYGGPDIMEMRLVLTGMCSKCKIHLGFQKVNVKKKKNVKKIYVDEIYIEISIIDIIIFWTYCFK